MLPSAMQAAGAQPTVRLFFALEIDLPASAQLAAKTLRLLDGAGVLTWGGNTFLGSDGDYGAWAGFESVEEGIATQSAATGLTLMPLTDAVVQQIGQPASQGSLITMYLGFLNLVTGQPVCDPPVYRYGVLNSCKRGVGKNSANLTVQMASYYEFLAMGGAGGKLSSAFHQQFFPNETGFAFVDNVQHQLPWGASGPRPDQVTDVRNYDSDPGPDQTTLKF